MTAAPTITAYVATDAEPAFRWLAFYRAPPPAPVPHGKAIARPFLPMYFSGPTREAVIERANAFWTEQQARLAREKEFITERTDRLRRVATKPSHPNFRQQEAAI